MCGIAGIVGSDSRTWVDSAQVRKMCAQIVYRGPDDEGIYTNGPVGLGMRRLSIIDVAGGQQPIHNEAKNVWAVFNGEIYNFQSLREELERLGHVFYTHSDTEVIVHAYEEFGSECVSRLRGMFSFALYDFRKNKLLLARDRFGKKPLHYSYLDGVLYFGSEIKSLLVVAPRLANVDQEALCEFFYYGYVPDPLTAFKNVKKLPPGHYLEFENNSTRIKAYWDLPQFCTTALPEEECLRALETELENAVRIRLISEVPLGALLSGGVDSSVVVAMMAKLSSSPVKTFTIGFKNKDFDEASHARSVAAQFATDHHELLVEADLWTTLDQLTGLVDEPFADSSIIPTFHVARMARKYVTVALSGDGGDELFAGYSSYRVQNERRYLDIIPFWLAPVYHKFVYRHLPSSLRNRRLAYSFPLNSRDRFVFSRAMLQSYDRDFSILSTDFLQSISHLKQPETVAQRYYDSAPAKDSISRMQYTDLKLYLTADVLTKVDRMSMACSLEIRSPLLDHVFAELAVGLPLNLKIRNGTQKYLLKRLAERLGVPAGALYRPKQGFALPLSHWMRSELRVELTSVLLEPRTLQRGYFQKSGIERLLKEHASRDRDHSQVLWQLLVFELWHRNYLERPSKAVMDEVEPLSI